MGEGILIYQARLLKRQMQEAKNAQFESNFRSQIRSSRPATNGQKPSKASLLRNFYKRKMARFETIKIQKQLNDGTIIKVGFKAYGNKHLYSDTFGRSKILQKEDLLELPSLLKRAQHVDSAELTKKRNDDIVGFHYFKVRIHGEYVYLNVAIEKKGDDLRYHLGYYPYAVTDKLKGS